MSHLYRIKNFLSSHPGFSEREEKIWHSLAQKLSAGEQNELYNYLKAHKKEIPPDPRAEFIKEGMDEILKERFIEARTILTPLPELDEFVQKTIKNYDKMEKMTVEKANKIMENIKNEDDAIKALVLIGPDGIEDIEEALVEAYLTNKTGFTLNEVLDYLLSYVQSKNVIAQENYRYMIEMVNIYKKGMQWAQTQIEAKLSRAEHLIEQIAG